MSEGAAPPLGLAWSALSFAVRGKDGAPPKEILKDVHGSVPAGEVCAVLGPSGSGKSTMLNVLAGRVVGGAGTRIAGHVSLDGVPISPARYRKKIAYVMQDDALDPTATPREALTFSAALRLGKNPVETKAAVEAMLTQLGLDECADTLVGGELIKGISGGERKRTSVGVELVTEPRTLFLDEPTSGLDSYTAFSVVSQLKRVARETGATVVCTIHQPSSEIFAMFDRVICLKSGRVVYSGPVDQLPEYMGARGYPLPVNFNPADHLMFCVQTSTVEQLEAAKMFQVLPPPASDTVGEAHSQTEVLQPVTTPFFTQLGWLLHRESKRNVRDVPALIGRFGITLFLNLLFGAIFYGAGSKDDANPQNANDHFGALVMVTISAMFGGAQPALLAFPVERPIFLREFSSGTYDSLPYFCSKVCVELPLSFAQTTVQWVAVYWLIGFQGSFILLLVTSFALASAATSVAICIGCITPDVKQAIEAVPLLFVPQMLFAGFFTRTTQIPVFLRWAQYLCSLKYTLNLIVIIEFSDKLCARGGPENVRFCKELKDGLDLKDDDAWLYALILFGLFAVFRTLGAIILAQKARSVY